MPFHKEDKNENTSYKRGVTMETVKITTEYITLQQLLKQVDAISSGGMVKWYLAENEVLVNGEPENRRGRKLYEGDAVSVPDLGEFTVAR